jgi:hypothetical protein
MNKSLEICIDFDGTCTTHDFPRVGKDVGAVPVLKELVENGHKLILFTMRSDIDEVTIPEGSGLCDVPYNYLTDAINWFKQNGIPLYGIQANPSQHTWTKSPKAYGNLYIDDAALGCPLVYPKEGRPYVDWGKVRESLIQMGVLNHKIQNND